MLDRAMFAEGFMRLARGQQVFVTEELTETYWDRLSGLTPEQWLHAYQIASEDPEPPKPGQMWTPGKLLGWGWSYRPERTALLPARTGVLASGHPGLPRRPGEEIVPYLERLARHLGHFPKRAQVMEMPETRLPYKEWEEAEVDRGDDADNY